MLDERTIGVVVPAYNEENLIGQVLETMPEFVDRIYVIDDCSPDNTSQVVQKYIDSCQLKGRVTLIRHQKNVGVGAAIVTGYKIAEEEGIDVVAVMAGDAQMDPLELEKIVRPIVEGKVDYVKGNRLFTGEAWELIPRYRYLGNALLSMMTKIASGYWHVADSQTGYTAISLDTLRLLPLDKLYSRYGYPNHILVMLNVYDQRVCDVPIRPIYDIGEKSGIRLYNVVPKISWLLFKCFFWRLKEKYIIRDFHPLIFFYLAGLTLFPTGVLFGLYLVIHRIATGPVAVTTALFAMFLTVSGLQFLLFAMSFDSERNRDLKER